MSTVDPKRWKKIEVEEYEALVEQLRPKPPLLKHCIWAFVVGGLICVLAQLIINLLLQQGIEQVAASSYTVIIMIFLGAFFTGIGIYDELGKRAGAGSIVPITGFANAIVASAMEFKREGYIFGVGARIFTVAGPTLLFGFVMAVLIGLIKVFISS